MKNIRTDTPEFQPDGPERDSCAIYMSARKQGQSTFGTLKRSLGALMHMGHRTGFVNGEGDGAGVQTDIPRRLWARKLSQSGLSSTLATHPGFWVGHLFVPYGLDIEQLTSEISTIVNRAGLNLLIHQPGRVRKEMLGQNARLEPPVFYQLAGYSDAVNLEKRLFDIQIALENNYPVHFCSLSSYTVVYKLRGSVEALARYYPDLQDINYNTSMVLCHARYSTNTVSTFERAQPFAMLGHNGEINTINRLRVEGQQIGTHLPQNGSDSQDLDRILHTLCVDYELSLVEAMEMIFPPTPYEIQNFPSDLEAAYQSLRQAFGPYAQGPAGIIARYRDTIVASVDALGLRPLWFVETEKEFVFSSERGAIPLENMITDARPLAPGEKIAIHFHRGENSEVWYHNQIREHVMVQSFQREAPQLASQYWTAWMKANLSSRSLNKSKGSFEPNGFINILEKTRDQNDQVDTLSANSDEFLACDFPWMCEAARPLDIAILVANGWLQDHLKDVQALTSDNKNDLVSSLGYDGPLAVLSKARVNIADYFKESVAVVTNPSIDHAREVEVFSTSTLIGACPPIGKAHNPHDALVMLELPIVLGGFAGSETQLYIQEIAQQYGTTTIEELLNTFADRVHWITLGIYPEENITTALQRIKQQAVQAVSDGVQCLVLDDQETGDAGLNWLDPVLATTALDDALRSAEPGPEGNYRRRVGIVVRTAAVRNLHDLVMLCSFGADVVNPYALIQVALKKLDKVLDDEESKKLLIKLVANLKDGIEKVISTMGCHELRGYGKVCASIGLSPSLAREFGSANYLGSEEVGLTWASLDQEAIQRGSEIRGEVKNLRPGHVGRFNPRIWKSVAAFAKGETGFEQVRKTYQSLAADMPVAIRHVVGIRHISDIVSPYDVDISVGEYNLPVVIDAMSFGSQGENSYMAYAQAASELNIICVNGEGGELPEMMGRFRQNRGQQVASGRFGVNVEFLNSAVVLEIKIGQGAKPGEGGLLPGYKVTEQVARARKTPPYVALISPSNNHDLYSIEDLAQLIEELHMVNPQAKISVKVPVVPGIGVIAVGIAKAGANIINISGYDGGTGAARKHSLQYVGLPVEIGIIQAHRALIEAGIRHKVELWANGGMKTGEDVVKMILLGANRVGFATVAMVAIGCTICRDCNLGTCHVGIATQVKTAEEAEERGIKHFKCLEYDQGVASLVRTFKGIGEEIRQYTAQLGVKHLQELVGRADLLEQINLFDKVDLSAMFEPAPVRPRTELEPGVGVLLIRPRNSLTKIISDLILQTVSEGEREVTYQDSVTAIDRALGSRLVGELIRQPEFLTKIDCLHLRFGPSALAGNGFAAWITDQVDILIEGGAQDGVAKGASGGRVAVMKGLNHEGLRMDGSVGKSFAYGAQGGMLIVQGNADSRACVRLSGAKVILGGEITKPVDDSDGCIGLHANIKGFACEYMTAGTVIIMGDPGPYAFSGMTGGIVYQLLTPEIGFDIDVLKRRLARGSSVDLIQIDNADVSSIQSLMNYYIEALEQTYQYEYADYVRTLCMDAVLMDRFIKIVPLQINSGILVEKTAIQKVPMLEQPQGL